MRHGGPHAPRCLASPGHGYTDSLNWRQLILNPFKNDLFEMCGECVQTIFTFKGLDVTGVKNGITGTLRAAAPKL